MYMTNDAESGKVTVITGHFSWAGPPEGVVCLLGIKENFML